MPTILVADDNSNIQKMVSLAFEEKGIRVVAVGNGEAACRKFPEVRPDVVLADVFMPVRNGYEVCEFVKKDPEFAQTPVILLVGAFDPLDEKEAARVGANGVLKKPFVPPEPLINLVSSLLEKTDAPQEKAPEPMRLTETARADSKIEYATEIPFVAPARKQSSSANEFRTRPAETDPDVEAAPARNLAPTPAPNEASEEDDLGPENAWVQRHTSMDYEIDAADSADLVERLARAKAGSGADESEGEILPSDKHVPFGGANIPEMPADEPRRKWSDFLVSKSSSPIDPPESAEVEQSLPEQADGHLTFASELAPPQLEIAEPEPLAKIARPEARPADHESPASEDPVQHSNVVPFTAQESNAEPPPRKEDSAPEPVFYSGATIEDSGESPSQEESPEIEVGSSVNLGNAPEEVSYALASDADSSESQPRTTEQEAVHNTPGPTIYSPSSEVELQAHSGAAVEPNASEKLATPASAPASERPDPATVDDVVARVISKLEPQLHEALANGVLRPLVEQLLNEKRDKK